MEGTRLQKIERLLQKELGDDLGQRVRLQLRKIPELSFFIDDSLDYIEHIDSLLNK